jgi:hypothetical protein
MNILWIVTPCSQFKLYASYIHHGYTVALLSELLQLGASRVTPIYSCNKSQTFTSAQPTLLRLLCHVSHDAHLSIVFTLY